MENTALSLTVADRVPDGFLDAPATDLIDVLPSPTLFDLPAGAHAPHAPAAPLFVSVLLHGNEDTGLLAIQEVLRRHAEHGLPRRLLLFVGNVAAAAAGRRRFDDQVDFNRAWPGTLTPEAPEAALMRQVVDYVAARKPFASIDIHNNTGLNPHYACVNRLESAFLYLALLFSRTVVFFEKPEGVQSAALAPICPAVTVECGKPGEKSATAHAAEFVEACLSLSGFPDHPPAAGDIDLLRTVAVVKIPPENSFSFDGGAADIRFRENIDHVNFSELESGSLFGSVAPGSCARLALELDAVSPHHEFFDYEGGEIRLARPAIPAMLTRDERAVRLDCLCYLMHRIDSRGALVLPVD